MNKIKTFKIPFLVFSIGAVIIALSIVAVQLYPAFALSDVSGLVKEDTTTSSGATVTTSQPDELSDQTSGSSKPSSKSGATTASSPTTHKPSTASSRKSSPVTPLPVTASSYSPRGQSLYVNPALASAGRSTAITSQSTATWFGEWSGDVRSSANNLVTAATSQGRLATLVVYNIPGRDCGSYSAGGASGSDAYKSWVRQLAAGIGNRSAIVILEPDALAQITCLGSTEQATRYALLADAVTVLSSQTKASIYIDAGHSAWIGATTMADRLQKANVQNARGFSLNVSNFQTSSSNRTYGDQVSAKIGKNYVIDTSRNGNGPNGEWCNPSGRALGERPTTNTSANLDAYLWIKVPGESDGTCNGGPSAGQWWEAYAQELITNAGY